ncbi:hypothetical protein HUU53_01135 [Candidatus Micrarchaeota archaeon]|nr:hypothetical protein [Candidatus Micrarchaeota archaeon]
MELLTEEQVWNQIHEHLGAKSPGIDELKKHTLKGLVGDLHMFQRGDKYAAQVVTLAAKEALRKKKSEKIRDSFEKERYGQFKNKK